ncbi:MAG: glycoside hydrolase family 25 protein [Lachnospiraceae bacterium]|nr:glycoside hydrolase family 25 protein [Lachnospiraceae bacterium]
MDENTKITTSKPKRKRLTKVVFYIMALMLFATTCMCGFITYNIIKNDSTDSQNKEATTPNISEPATDTSAPVADGYTLMSEEMIEKLKDESYYLGRDNLLSSIKNMMEGGSTTLKMLRAIYPDYLIYNDKNGFVFKNINIDLVMNDYDDAGFKIEKDENDIPTKVEYFEDDKLVSYTGIDVSKHNGNIDWSKVAKSNIDFAIIRAAVRGYGTEGRLLPDENFAKNAKAATENGITVGAYVFSEAITVDEAIEEAELILSSIEPYKIKGPVVIDIEDIQNDTGRNETLSPKELTDIVLAFCNKVKEKGYTPMIYCNLKGFIGMLEFERLEGIEKWYAYYGDQLYFPYDVSIWQYTSNGKVDGVNGVVDLNISFKKYE